MRYRLRTLLILLALLPPIIAAVGIALFNLKEPPASVSGMVTWKGQPVAAGVIVFTSEADSTRKFQARTDPAGTYAVPGDPSGGTLQPGTYQVTVVLPPNLPPSRQPGLTASISPGQNQLDFELK